MHMLFILIIISQYWLNTLEELRADNVGGICRTLPVNNTNVCVAIACALK